MRKDNMKKLALNQHISRKLREIKTLTSLRKYRGVGAAGRLLLSVGTLLGIGFLTVPTVVNADRDHGDHRSWGHGFRHHDLEFRAKLTGDEEVPDPVITDTTGEAEFEVNKKQTAIEFELEVKNAVDILGAAGAHIHCAPFGENGPVVVFLAGEVPGGFDGEVEIKATITEANIVNDACGATLLELIESMKEGNTYVNVHSIANPAGEVRGQIEED